jgi:hypothetical protein
VDPTAIRRRGGRSFEGGESISPVGGIFPSSLTPNDPTQVAKLKVLGYSLSVPLSVDDHEPAMLGYPT